MTRAEQARATDPQGVRSSTRPTEPRVSIDGTSRPRLAKSVSSRFDTRWTTRLSGNRHDCDYSRGWPGRLSALDDRDRGRDGHDDLRHRDDGDRCRLAAHARRILRRAGSARVGDNFVRHRNDDRNRLRRLAQRPVRSASIVPRLDRRIHGRIRPVRNGWIPDGTGAVADLARHPGRTPDPARAGDHHRLLRARTPKVSVLPCGVWA